MQAPPALRADNPAGQLDQVSCRSSDNGSWRGDLHRAARHNGPVMGLKLASDRSHVALPFCLFCELSSSFLSFERGELQANWAAVGPSHIRLRRNKAMSVAPGLLFRRQCIMGVEHHSFLLNHACMPSPSAPAYLYDDKRRIRGAVNFDECISDFLARNRSWRSNTTKETILMYGKTELVIL